MEKHDGEIEIEGSFLFFLSLLPEGGERDHIVGRVDRLKCYGKILEKNYGKVILDRKHLCFLVWIINRGHLNAAGDYAD